MRIAVYGNLIYDQLILPDTPFCVGSSHNCLVTESAGGLANFCRAGCKYYDITAVSKVGKDQYGFYLTEELHKMSNIDMAISVYNSFPTSFATVIVDKTNNSRTGMVRWGACRHMGMWKAKTADWHHIMYLDRMTISPSEIRRMQGIISADICTSEEVLKYYSLISEIDYLFMSEPAFTINESRIPAKRGVIIHSPEKIIIKFKERIEQYTIQKETGLNVVGAGDYLAAFCIADLARDKLNLELAHLRTLEQLRTQS